MYTGTFRDLDFQVYTGIGRSLGVRKVDLDVLRIGFACEGVDESRRQDHLGEGIDPLRGTSIHLHILQRTGLVLRKYSITCGKSSTNSMIFCLFPFSGCISPAHPKPSLQ